MSTMNYYLKHSFQANHNLIHLTYIVVDILKVFLDDSLIDLTSANYIADVLKANNDSAKLNWRYLGSKFLLRSLQINLRFLRR